MKSIARTTLPTLCVMSALLLGACSGKTETAAPASAPTAAASAPAATASAPLQPVTVTTVKAQKRDFPVNLQGNGIVTPLTSVDLRSQVTSTVAKLHFSDGQFVKAGQLLITLDSRTDEANLAKARAQLVKDQAAVADAKRQFERAKQLFAQNFISQGAVDTAQTLVESTSASTVADQAAIDASKVSLSFDRITAPISGRAGVVNVSVGSLVQANTTSLVTITQLDPIAIAFSIPQRNLPDALAALKAGGAPVTAKLADGGGSFKGRLQFVDNSVTASSGTVQARAVFANKEGKLWPGAYVDISQTVTTLADATTIPQAAVVQGTRGTIVYVLDDGKARLQPIKVVYAEGTEAAVTGIQPGDIVVMDGKQNVRPGSPLVERAKAPAAAASGTAAADASKAAASQASGTSKP
ncbi:efflux RND transporter periplasmic adaptor subunit [Rhodoferax lacus]|uniref:Efflux RND transporter periplasmic adaptor subunit n=1 Tax=Rhodoferax lacus TaxID=2184758 RepID=A0A3E1RGB9_9BURK|nr:efflux RND transporter periplasmic adaptor subunit [Rhodoferax lacus]